VELRIPATSHLNRYHFESLKELIPKKSAMLRGDERAAKRLLMYNGSR
jgi:hypothetical protein